jgi:hypothetical protein
LTLEKSLDATVSFGVNMDMETHPAGVVYDYDSAIKASYIRARKEQLQRKVVNVRNSTTAVVGLTAWTFRTTSCDVISLVTTTVPVTNGAMKDIKLHNKEMRR